MDIEKINKDIEERDRVFKGVQKTIVVFGSARIHKPGGTGPNKESIREESRKAISDVFPELISEDISKNGKMGFRVQKR